MNAPVPEPPLSPVGCLALLWPLLPEDLVGQADRAGLEAAAARLPPVPSVALELRLDGANLAIDLHQLITRDRLHLLPPWLSANPPRTNGEARLHRCLARWADGGTPDVSQVFLEWDRPVAPSADPAPGVFLPLDTPDARLGVVIEELCGTAALDRLAEIRKKLPQGASINFLGIMLGRGGALRVNLRQLRADELGPLLTAIGWTGDIAAAERHFDALVPLCDRVAVALDFAPELEPAIGFELFFHNGPAREPRYGPLFDRIETLGLCAPSRRAALAGLDTQLLSEAEGQPWPAAWAVAAAAHPDHDVPLLRVRLSHLKLSLDRNGVASAKAYVSARHQWSHDAAEAPPPSPSHRTRSQAHTAALAFLLHEQCQDALWRDFAIVNGASDFWVSAIVGLAVAPHAPLAANRARAALLRAREPAAGWGYNAISPPDADSSAWVLRFLHALDAADPRAAAIEAFLGRHLLEDGFTTYASTTPVRFGEAGADDCGWRGSHDCVAANAAGVTSGDLRESLQTLLRDNQRPEGHWQAYWWRSDILATALAIDALAPCEARRKALGWMRDQQAKNDFDLAWQAIALRAGDSDEQVIGSALADRLAARQRADGSWLPGAEMLFPEPDRPLRASEPRIYPDHRRLLTTASALMALEAWR